MKIIRLTLIAIAIAASASIFSCTKSQSPVQEYVDILQTATEELSKATSEEETTKMIAEGSSTWMEKESKIMSDNADYKLTDEDKQKLRDALKGYMEVTIKKSLEISHQSTEGVQEIATSVLENTVYPAIDRAETLGDLNVAPSK